VEALEAARAPVDISWRAQSSAVAPPSLNTEEMPPVFIGDTSVKSRKIAQKF